MTSRRAVLSGLGAAVLGVGVLGPASAADAGTPEMTVLTDRPGTAPGSIFYTSIGLIIADRHGATTYHAQPAPECADFRVQDYLGRQRLTWWQGGAAGGGSDRLADPTTHAVVGTIGARGDLVPDLHEFRITPWNTALIIAFEVVPYDLTPVGGPADGQLIDCLWAEVDVASGAVLRQWRASDHVALTDSYAEVPTDATEPFDFFHMNSVNPDTDGNLLVSSRHTWTVFKIERGTGRILWRLGGKRSDFRLGAAATFSWQHNALPAGGGLLRLFDNGSNGLSTQRPASRVVWLRLGADTASLVRQLVHPDGVSAPAMGNAQALPNGNTFVGWGAASRLSEFDAAGRLLFDATLPDSSYRAYRYQLG